MANFSFTVGFHTELPACVLYFLFYEAKKTQVFSSTSQGKRNLCLLCHVLAT